MDILIKNMEMPQERKMFVIEADGSVWVQIKDSSYFCTGSKAVALPSHGDLIDRKETRKQILEELSKMKIKLPFDVFGLIVDRVEFLLTKAPTIVEATE